MPCTVSVPVEAAAPADLDHVAERLGVGRLADDAGVERSPRAFSQSSTLRVPLIEMPSSSPVMSRLIEPPNAGPRAARKRDAAAAKQAIAPFMSAAPRPTSAPSTMSAANGSIDQARGIAGRHHVGMAGEAEIAACRADPGVEVEDGSVPASEKTRR